MCVVVLRDVLSRIRVRLRPSNIRVLPAFRVIKDGGLSGEELNLLYRNFHLAWSSCIPISVRATILTAHPR